MGCDGGIMRMGRMGWYCGLLPVRAATAAKPAGALTSVDAVGRPDLAGRRKTRQIAVWYYPAGRLAYCRS